MSESTPLTDGRQIDPYAPAPARPETQTEILADMRAQLAELVDMLTPGTPGIEGAEETPELEVDAFTVGTTIFKILGRQRRTSLSIYNGGPDILYIVNFPHITAAKKHPIPVDSERELKTANAVYLLSAGTSAVTTLQEAS